MSIHIRQLELPNDYESVARLLSIATQKRVAAEEVEAEDRRIPTENRIDFDGKGHLTGFCRERVVAVDESGTIVGYAGSWRAPWTQPGQLGSNLAVEPQAQGRGVGSALLDHIEEWAHRTGAHMLLSEVPDSLGASVSFVENRGYTLERHLYTSILSLDHEAAMESTSLHGGTAEHRSQPLPGGLRVLNGEEVLRDFGHDALYKLYTTTEQDIPGQRGSTQYHEWLEEVEKTPSHCILVAVDDNRPVGVTHLTPIKETTGWYNWYTGVDKAYRGRGIAKALKVVSIHIARQHGVTFMKTDNDSENHAMLSVNRMLGYIPSPGGHYRVYKKLR